MSKIFEVSQNHAECFKREEKYFHSSRKYEIEKLREKLNDEQRVLLLSGPYLSGKTCLCYEWYDNLVKNDEYAIWVGLGSKNDDCFISIGNELTEEYEMMVGQHVDKFFLNFKNQNPSKLFYVFLDDLYEGEEANHSTCVKHLKDKFQFLRIICTGHDPLMLLTAERTPFRVENVVYSPMFSKETVVNLMQQVWKEYNIGDVEGISVLCEEIYREFAGYPGLTASFLNQVLSSFKERNRRSASSQEESDGSIGIDSIITKTLRSFESSRMSEFEIDLESVVSSTRLFSHYNSLERSAEGLFEFVESFLHFEGGMTEQEDGTFCRFYEEGSVGSETKRLFRLGFIQGTRIEQEQKTLLKFHPMSSFHIHWMLKKYKKYSKKIEKDLVDRLEVYLNERDYDHFFQKLMKMVDIEKLKNERCWSKISRSGPSEKIYQFEFNRILCDMTKWVCFAEYTLERKKLDLVLKHGEEDIKYNIEIIANSSHSPKDKTKHSVEHHWKRNLEVYDKLDTFKKHFCVALYHGDRVTKHFRPKSSEKQSLYYILTNRDFSKVTFWISTKEELKKEEFELRKELRTKMIDEESETKMFKVFSFVKNTKADVHLKKKRISQSALLQHFYEQCGGRHSPKKKSTKKREMKDEDDEEEGEFPWDNYSIYDQDFTLLPSIDAVWKKHDGDELYLLTDEEKKLKEEEEARKLKEEEEARKLQNDEGEPIKVRVFFVSDEKKLDYVDIDLFADDEEIILKMNFENSKEYVHEYESYKLQSGRRDKNDLNFYFYSSVESEISGSWGGDVVGKDMRTHGDYRSKNNANEFSSHYLLGQFCFLLSKGEKEDVNKLYRQVSGSSTKEKEEQGGGIDVSKLNLFRAGSGMSFLDKWFDDEDEEKGTGAISVDSMKDEDSEWNKEILLECCDGGKVRKNMDELLQNSRFFRKMISFNGKEAREAREDGKIKLEFLTSLELQYYMKVIFDVEEDNEVGGSENNRIRLLLRLLEFGMRYQERKLAEKVVNELETQIFPDLVSCDVLDLRLMELGHLVHGRLPSGLLEELLDRLCSQQHVGEEANKMMRYIEYSSQVMEKAHTFLEEGEKDMLDEDCVQVDYGVGEVVSGNGNVLDQCFVGEFGGRLMVWNDSGDCSSSFVGCLKDSTFERALIKTKRLREEEYSGKVKCVGEGKVRKLMTCGGFESFLRK